MSVDSITSDLTGYALVAPEVPYRHSANAVHLYLLLAVAAGDVMVSWASVEKMGRSIGMSLSTTKRALAELEAAGTIINKTHTDLRGASGYHLPLGRL